MDAMTQHHINSLEHTLRILATYIRERDGEAAYEKAIGKYLHDMQIKMAPTQEMQNVYNQVVTNLMKPPQWL